jgi:hypothetical protein
MRADGIFTKYFDHGDEGGVIVRGQDVNPALDACKELHNTGMHGRPDMKHVASVPQVVIEDWCRKIGVRFSEFVRDQALQARFLNDPDLKAFRIWPGRV